RFRRQLHHTQEERADDAVLLGGDATDVEAAGIPVEAWQRRERDGDGESRTRPLSEDDRSREHVAESLAAGCEENGEGGDDPDRRNEEVNHGDHGADGGLAKTDRRAFDGHDAQAEHSLADGSALPPCFEQHRIAEDDQEGADDQHHDRGTRADAEADEAGNEREPVEQADPHEEVDELGERARRDAAGLELEDHRLGRDDATHLGTHHSYRHGHVPYRDPWTSIASSCTTRARGAGWRTS